jgi:hypothetical protein
MNKAQQPRADDLWSSLRYRWTLTPCAGGTMRKLLCTAAIVFAVATTGEPRVFAQNNVPGPKPLVTTPAALPSIQLRNNMFLDSGTPARPSTSMEFKEVTKPSFKKETESGKGEQGTTDSTKKPKH